jgi:DNA-binding CsgD family transcriptional regulator
VNYEMFAAIGAAAFAERMRVEMMATGERVQHRNPRSALQLTDGESQIAHLAAERATSREIAERLYLSANTVEYHLRKVFQKLDINSRRDSARRLGEGGVE